MKSAGILFVWVSYALGVQLPAGTELSVRLNDKIASDASDLKTPVRAVIIAPVIVDGRIAVPMGVLLTGEVQAATAAADKVPAQLQLVFTRLGTVPVNAVIASLENSRETVDETGKIIGIDVSNTYGGLLDRGVSKLQTSDRFAGLAGLIQGAKQVLKIQDVNPNIDYEPGVEMTLRLTHAVGWQSTATGPESKLVSFRNEDALPELVNREPFRTVARSAERASDLTNLMFIGTAEEVMAAFTKAGWSAASTLSGVSKLETARALIEDRGYKEGPMSVLLLDGQPPEFAYQKGNNTFSQRHHLRIFRRPGSFAGKPVWVCSATHDVDIRYSDRDYTFIHVIDPDIDKERSKVVNDLIFTGMVRSLALVDRYDIPQNATNATGDPLHTDGRMAVLLLQ